MPVRKTTTTTTTYKLASRKSKDQPTTDSSSNNSNSSNIVCMPLAESTPKQTSHAISIPRILSRISTLLIVFERDLSTFYLFNNALCRLQESVHQLSTMLFSLDSEQRLRMDLAGWLEETWQLLHHVKGAVNDLFESDGKLSRAWKRIVRVRIEGVWWDNGRVTALSVEVLEHCVKLNTRYQRLIYDLLRAQEGEVDE